MIENSHAQEETEPYTQGMPSSGDMPPLPDIAHSGAANRDSGAASGMVPARGTRPHPSPAGENDTVIEPEQEYDPSHGPTSVPSGSIGAPNAPAFLDALANLAELASSGADTIDPVAALYRALSLALPFLPSLVTLAAYGRDESAERAERLESVPGTRTGFMLLASTPRQASQASQTSAVAPTSKRARGDRTSPVDGSVPFSRRLAPDVVARLSDTSSDVSEFVAADGVWYVALPGAGGLFGVLAAIPALKRQGLIAQTTQEQTSLRILRASLGTILERRARLSQARHLTGALQAPVGGNVLGDQLQATPSAKDEIAFETQIVRDAARTLASIAPGLAAYALTVEPGSMEAHAITLEGMRRAGDEDHLSDEATTRIFGELRPNHVVVLTDGRGDEHTASHANACWNALAPIRASLADQFGQPIGVLLVLGLRASTRPLGLVVLGQPGRALDPLLPPVASLLGSLAEAQWAALAAATAGEEQARAFDRFLSLAAHELRSPLTSVKGYGQLLLRQAGKLELPERVVRSAESIVQQAERLAEMIDELHDAARIRRGRLELAREPVDLVTIIERIIPRLQHEYPRRQIELAREVDTAIGDWDATRVAQCVRALIDNALRFSPDAGTVRVELRTQARPDTPDSPGEAVLCVRDRGIGIPPDEREHIFDFLYRGPSAEQRNLAGLGLGLFVAGNIARMLGGRLWLAWSASDRDGARDGARETETLTGAEFCLALPLAHAPEDTPE